MHTERKQRLEELRSRFTVTEVNGKNSPDDVVAQTIAMHLNQKYGRQVVVPRDRKEGGGSGRKP